MRYRVKKISLIYVIWFTDLLKKRQNISLKLSLLGEDNPREEEKTIAQLSCKFDKPFTPKVYTYIISNSEITIYLQVSSPHTVDMPCSHSAHPTYPSSSMIGAPRIPPPHTPNPALLRQVLAHQNSMLEALSQQLGSYRSQIGARTAEHHTLGSSGLTGRCYCPDNGSSSIVGAPNPSGSEAPGMLGMAAPKEANGSETKETKESDEKTIVGAKNSVGKEETAEVKSEKNVKRESRPSSSTRNKRGDVKYVSKKN